MEKLTKILKKIQSKIPDKKKMFWAWIGYQAVKGTITTSLIWIPAIHLWLTHHN